MDRNVLAIIALIIAILALGLSVHGITNTQTGTASCISAINSFGCTTGTITFPQSYSSIPIIDRDISTFVPGPTTSISTTTRSTQNIIFSNPTGNSSILLFNSETPASITIPNVDTAIKSFAPAWPVPSPGFLGLLVESDGYVTVTLAGAISQDISISLEDVNAGTILQTVKIHFSAITVNEKFPFHLRAIDTAPIFFGFSDSVNVIAPAADGNTQITAVNLRVEGLQQNFQTWLNPPANPTPLFGTSDLQFVNIPAGVSGNEQVLVCVNVIFGGNTPMNVTLQESTSQSGPWSAIASDFLGTPLSCQDNYTVNLPSGVIYLRVVMEKGTGVNDILMVGKIDASIIYPFVLSTSYPVPFFLSLVAVTQTSFQIKITFTLALNVQVIASFVWTAKG